MRPQGNHRPGIGLSAAAFAAVVGLTAACAEQVALPEVVPAAAPNVAEGHAIAVRYWAEIHPKQGRMDLFKLHPGNVIYRGGAEPQPPADGELVSSNQTALTYDYGTTATTVTNADCTGAPFGCPADSVHMFTDQTIVTYVEDSDGITADDGSSADDDCYRNGVFFDNDPTCGGLYTLGHPCTVHATFCAPVRMISNFAVPLSDPILDIAQGPENTVLGCVDDAAQTTGLCASDNPFKVNSALGSTDFTPSIAGSGGTDSCAYCYGNTSRANAQNRPGLIDSMVRNTSSTVHGINTNLVVLRFCDNDLACGGDFNSTLTVHYALPALDPPGSQLSIDNGVSNCYDPTLANSLLVSGGGFGPPGACQVLSTPAACNTGVFPPTGCCAQGPALNTPAYNLTVVGPTSGASQKPALWGDQVVQTAALPQGVYGCGVTVTTPFGAMTTADDLPVCADTWRRWSGLSSTLTRRHAAGGVINNNIIVAGGRTGGPATGLSTAVSLPIPRCSAPNPTATTALPSFPDTNEDADANPDTKWGAGYAVAGNQLYLIGGARSDIACSNRVFRLNATAWVEVRQLPAAVCQPTAMRVVDSSSGREQIVVVGGIMNSPIPFGNGFTQPVFNTSTFVYDVATNQWTTHTQAGRVLATPRFNASGATSSNGRTGLVVGGTATLSGSGAPITNVDSITTSFGVPTIVSRSPVPVGRILPGVSNVDGTFVVAGGGVNSGSSTTGTTDVFTIAEGALGGGWTTQRPLPVGRAHGLLLRVAFDEPVFEDLTRLVFITGNNTDAALTEANEYENNGSGP